MLSSRRFASTRWAQKAIGLTAAHYLRLVWATTRFTIEPAEPYERFDPHLPVIIAMWHGQHFLMPFIRKPEHRAKVLISRHRDGEINAIAAERLGIGTIRGSGSHGRDFSTKGGIFAFSEVVAALRQGFNVALTADVPKVGRVAGLGIVKIAQVSGRPIVPVAVATRRRMVLDNWDRSAINLPFGRGGVAVGELIRVPAQASDEELQHARRSVEAALNTVTRRAYELADGAPSIEPGGARG